MSCEGTGPITEWELFTALPARRGWADCTGPLLPMALRTLRLAALETALQCHPRWITTLWDGYRGDAGPAGLVFVLCAGHWLDMTLAVNAHTRTGDWNDMAGLLLRNMCARGGWDVKEILNLLAWQCVALTRDSRQI